MKRAATHQEHIDRMNLAILVENVTVSYDEQPVLWNVNLEVPENSTMAIIGPNKAGKSTLLKTILGIIKPNTGKVFIYSRPTDILKNDVAWIPERASVNWKFPTTVYDVAYMGTYNKITKDKKEKKSNKELVENALILTQLIDFRKSAINDLTHSQQQRLLIARALVQNPRIFVMDEPFFSADEHSKDIIINILTHIKNTGRTTLIALHDIFNTPLYYDMAALLNVKLIDYGNTSDILTEENLINTYGSKINFVKIFNDGSDDD